MRHNTRALWRIAVILAISFILVACGSSKNDLLLGRWEPSDGGKYGYQFREFTSDDPQNVRTLPSGEQDGVVIILSGDAGAEATYSLSKEGELRINIWTQTASMGYIYKIESISNDKLVLRDSMSGQTHEFARAVEDN